eukprot:2975536-Pyramimonas_sp.AAC.1
MCQAAERAASPPTGAQDPRGGEPAVASSAERRPRPGARAAPEEEADVAPLDHVDQLRSRPCELEMTPPN